MTHRAEMIPVVCPIQENEKLELDSFLEPDCVHP